MRTYVIGWLSMFFLGVLIIGCSNGTKKEAGGDQGPANIGPTGKMSLALVATSETGEIYRLRDAVFSIWGIFNETYVSVYTEDNPDAVTIDLDLSPDLYEVYLNSGWRLECIQGCEGGTVPIYPEDTDSYYPSDTEGYYDAGVVIGTDTAVVDFQNFSQINDPREISALRKPSGRRLPIAVFADTDDEEDDYEDDEEPIDFDTGDTEEEWEDTAYEDAGVGDGGPVTVGAMLISDNPALVEIVANETSRLDFVFMLDGTIIVTEKGELSIGIQVIPPDASCVDEYEPNDSIDDATPTGEELDITATLCGYDEDFFMLIPPVEEGEAFAVDVKFSHTDGDIDVFLIDQYESLVSIGGSVSDNETVGTYSDGGPYYLLVFLYSGGPAEYTVEYGEATISDCCTPAPFPGCIDPEVEECVCNLDSYCCEIEFDSICSQISLIECGGSCPLGEGDCCEVSEEPGCNDQEVQDCICAIDLYCCMVEYDDICVTEAAASCNANCEVPPPDSDCCNVGSNPGCLDPEVEACVCDIDPICCALPFDDACVGIAADLCGAAC